MCGASSAETNLTERNSTERLNKVRVEQIKVQSEDRWWPDCPQFTAVLAVEAYLVLMRKCRQSVQGEQITLSRVMAVKEYKILFTFFF